VGWSGPANPLVLLEFGASFKPYVERGEYWRLVMPMFLHAGLAHIVLNGLGLYALGRILERIYGYGRFTCLYVGAGIGGSLLSVWRSSGIAVGASGAIFGIAGAIVVTGYLRREITSPRWRRVFGRLMVLAILADLALGIEIPTIARWLRLGEVRIDNWAHVGGLVTGMALAALVPPPPRREYGYLYGPVARERSPAIVALPVAIVVLSMAFAAERYRAYLAVTRSLEESARLRAAHQDDRALGLAQEAARRSPTDERPHEQLGLMYLEQKRIPEAIQEYSEVLRLSPDSPQAQLGLALAYREKGDLAKSRELFEAVAKETPQDADSQEALADVCAELKLYEEAVSHYQRALGLDPHMAAAHNNLAWLDATAEDPHFRNAEQALDHARRAVELSAWKQPEYLDTLAEALYLNQQYAEAVRVQTKALELAPGNPEYQDHMARYRKAAGA
jgi:rhomboid protease GluP